jgi:threonine/homoserine/homoserine lactone efflux protein
MPTTTTLLAFAALALGMVLSAGTVAYFLAGRPLWQRLQRRLMATVLAGLACRMAAERAR